MLMLLFILLSYIPNIAGTVTLYEWPYYKGRSFTLSDNDTSIQQIHWLGSIQSIEISPNESFITYDQDYCQGNNATWYRSVVYPGNWKDRIRSYRIVPVIPPPINPEKQNAIQAPWYFMGTWEGYIMIRMSTQWPGYPECYAVNGVNCILGKEVNDLLPVLKAYQNNATLNGSSATFNAPCGPARYEHWGSNLEWCAKATRHLQNPPTKTERMNLACLGSPRGFLAQYISFPNAMCIPATEPISVYKCRYFRSIADCSASCEYYAYSERTKSDAFISCSNADGCWAMTTPTHEIPVATNGTQVLFILLGSALLTITGLIISCRYKGRNRSQSLYRLSETCKSVDDYRENGNDLGNTFVRAT